MRACVCVLTIQDLLNVIFISSLTNIILPNGLSFNPNQFEDILQPTVWQLKCLSIYSLVI